MEIKITRRKKLYEIHNSMVSNYCYLIYGRIINDNNTRYRAFKFVVMIDEMDIEDGQTVEEYLEECIFCFTDTIIDYYDCTMFYEMCNNSIEQYRDCILYNMI